jgi:hypothetical protein
MGRRVNEEGYREAQELLAQTGTERPTLGEEECVEKIYMAVLDMLEELKNETRAKQQQSTLTSFLHLKWPNFYTRQSPLDHALLLLFL